MNAINVIYPYNWHGLWVFDDPDKGLNKEPFVAGMPKIIERAIELAKIKDAEQGFVALFSATPFPFHHFVLERTRSESGGNVYKFGSAEGWLCPALLKYFKQAPERIYVQLEGKEQATSYANN